MQITLLATSPTEERIRNLIGKYYMGSTITLTRQEDGTFSVATGKGVCDGMRVRVHRGRYRFEMCKPS